MQNRQNNHNNSWHSYKTLFQKVSFDLTVRKELQETELRT